MINRRQAGEVNIYIRLLSCCNLTTLTIRNSGTTLSLVNDEAFFVSLMTT